MDEIWDRIKSNFKNSKIKHKHLVLALASTEILGILVFLWILRAPLSQKFFTTEPKAYSVVSLNPKKRYLISQGDLLTGKAIPGTQVKVLITPGYQKTQIQADSKGEWWYQTPPNLEKKVHTITFGNFDKKNKLVTFQSYKFRVQSNISILRPLDSLWRRTSALFNPKPANAQIRYGTYPDLYAKTGLPHPENPISLPEDQKFRFNNYFLPYAYTAAKIVGADWRLMAMFTFREEQFNSYLDNCLDGNRGYGPDADFDPNTPCTGWGIPQWQVGWGHYPAQWANEKLAEAIAVMRPGKTIQQIGQEVIDNSNNLDMYATYGHLKQEDLATYRNPITYPDRFPDNVSLDEIIEGSQAILNDGKEANTEPTPEEKNLVLGTKTCRPIVDKNTNPRQDPKDCYMRQLLGILMKDPAVSAYLLASMWKDLSQEQQIVTEIQYQWGQGNNILQEASDILAGFDNEVREIDLDALTTTPQISMPVAVADPNKSAEPQVNIDTVVSESGSALDDSEVVNKNLIVERVVIPYGTSEYDLMQPVPGQPNVRGISTTEQIFLDQEQSQNPGDYQICALLKSIDYSNIIIDSDCTPLDQIIDPQIPSDKTSTPGDTTASCEINPEAGEFFCDEGVCRSTEYDCSSGRRWYFDEFKNPQNGCEFEAKQNTEGEFAGLWYHGDEDPACYEVSPDSTFESEPVQEDQTLSCEPSNWIDEQPYSCQDGYACYNRWKITGGDSCEPEPDYGEDGLWYVCYQNPNCGSAEN